MEIDKKGNFPKTTVMAIALLAASAVVASCQSSGQPQQPQPKAKNFPNTREGRCMAIADAISNPWVDDRTAAMAMELGRNNQCFGKAPPTEVNLTIK